jgi:hypothetical protein
MKLSTFLPAVIVVLVAMSTGTSAAMKALRNRKEADAEPSVIPHFSKPNRRRRLNGKVSSSHESNIQQISGRLLLLTAWNGPFPYFAG